MISESESDGFQSFESDESEVEEGQADWTYKERSTRRAQQGLEAVQANRQAQREQMEEEAGQKCRVGMWTWDDPITPQCALVVRHDGGDPSRKS